ncbi:hypothetical protein M9H77_05850 [Catharanthus roseus]|uniref:Uncharacterized protein n=1 Tax=Catharanthus roseus TaxID=4058 RepID=A0ACC0BQF1_CATRO|nr:hypothetical protein M9H77_05850 [Catharanthus roseus]
MADGMFIEIQGDYCHVRGNGTGEAVVEDKQETWFQMDQEREKAHSNLFNVSSLCDQRISMANKGSVCANTQYSTPQHWMQNQLQEKDMILHICESSRPEDVQRQLFKVGKSPKEKPHNSFSLASLELLNNYGKVSKHVSNETVSVIASAEDVRSKKLSVGEIVRVAGERYIQFSNQKFDGLSMFIHPYSSALSNLSIEETADVELVQHLLAAAELVGQEQFDIASALITRCQWIASDIGNAVQRIVFYFAEALQQRIEIETGRTTLDRIQEQVAYQMKLQVDFHVSFLECHRVIPFSQVLQLAAVESIVESFKTASKIHLIDLHIRSGIQWTALMQALAERFDNPLLKISALETTNKQHLEETGKRLMSFAQSMNISFSFHIVSVSDMKDLREEMFKREPDEAVAVYSSLILRTMISNPDNLRSVMRAVRKLRPSIFVVIEVEANHNSPSFVSRFIESLFFYGAYFDCLEDCMERDNLHRKTIEGIYLGGGIRNIVGTEGDRRCTRNVKVEVWREYFTRFGMAEVELSESSLRQAYMVLKKFTKASGCTLTNNGKGLVIGWKGTPIHSLTTWKFL